MSEFTTYVELGLRHILDIGAVDHLLFLAALAAIYQLRDWRAILWVVSAFTIGHSLTLALAVTGVISLPAATIEFLIALTIVASCAGNLVVREHARGAGQRYRPVIAGVFGLIHGAGFATYLKSLFLVNVALPIFAFNVGIEIAQVIVLTAIGVAYTVADAAIRRGMHLNADSATRVRSMVVSVIVGMVAVWWTVERIPR